MDITVSPMLPIWKIRTVSGPVVIRFLSPDSRVETHRARPFAGLETLRPQSYLPWKRRASSSRRPANESGARLVRCENRFFRTVFEKLIDCELGARPVPGGVIV